MCTKYQLCKMMISLLCLSLALNFLKNFNYFNIILIFYIVYRPLSSIQALSVLGGCARRTAVTL